MGSKTALLLIDAQVNMFGPVHPVEGSDALLERLRSLVQRARAAGAPVVFVRNTGSEGDPDIPGTPGWELHPDLQPATGETLLDKTTCNTFASTPLGELLTARGITGVVIAGMQSDWCIRETTLGALDLGYQVTLASDGHSTYDGKTRTAAAISVAVNEEMSGRARLVRAAEVAFEG